MKTILCISFLFACATVHAASVTYSSLIDPAQVAFCTDPEHPVCVELVQISFTDIPAAPSGVSIVDENGFATVYNFQNLNVTVDPDGTTFSGSITPDEPFSITQAQNTDLQEGLFELEVVGDELGVGDGGSDSNTSGTVLAGTELAATTPEPATCSLLLAGFAIAYASGRAKWSLRRTR